MRYKRPANRFTEWKYRVDLQNPLFFEGGIAIDLELPEQPAVFAYEGQKSLAPSLMRQQGISQNNACG